MDEKNNMNIDKSIIGIFALGLTVSLLVGLLANSEIFAVATSICYASAIISSALRK